MFVCTDLGPTIGREQFCDLILRYPKWSREEQQQRYDELTRCVRDRFPENGRFTLKWLAQTLSKIDELYYCGQLIRFLCQEFGGVHVESTVDEEKTAGYVVVNPDQQLELRLNQDMFIDLFEQPDRAYHAGGLLCANRYECLMQVLLHECVHLALTLFEKQGLYRDARDHGKQFMHIVRNMLGHCDSQHGLVPDLVHSESLCETKKQLKPGDNVKCFFKGRYEPATVLGVHKKFVEVNVRGKPYRVHFGTIERNA